MNLESTLPHRPTLWAPIIAVFFAIITASAASAQTIQQQIDAIFDGLPGSHTLSGRIENEDGSVVYYTHNASTPKTPASVTKSFVVASSLGLLGEDHRFVTRVYRDGAIDGAGVLSGDLILLGDHDFTWASDYYTGNPRFALDRLAERLFDLGLREVTGSVRGYGYLMYAEVRSNLDAATAFRDALNAAGIVANSIGTSSSFSPPGVVMTEWRSMPLSQACRDLLKVSDNDDAQAMMRHLGRELLGATNDAASDAAGESLIQDWLASRGVSITGSNFDEGAGLSHGNKVTALQGVGLTRLMLRQSAGRYFSAMLPIGGVDGTLASRFTSGAAFGRVHAKTGTLTGVVALNGYIVNPIDDRRYLFAFLVNDISGLTSTEARNAMDQAVALMAGDVNSIAGSPPPAPTLLRVIGDGGSQTVDLAWTASALATAYHVYRSPDGMNWSLDASVAATSTTVAAPTTHETDYFMVRAANALGESADSDAYGVRLTDDDTRVLIVDGNDRWTTQPENPEAANQLFAVELARMTTPAVALDACANEQIISGAVSLGNYDAVLWMTGEESTANESFSTTEQAAVQAYLGAGGSLFVSGAEIGWDLVAQGTGSDAAFYGNVLKTSYVADDANTEVAEFSGGVFADLAGRIIHFFPTWMVVGFPDVIAPTLGSAANLIYRSNGGANAGGAGVEFDGSYRLINLGFPIENVVHRESAALLMNRVLSFLLDDEYPDDVIIEVRDADGQLTGPPGYAESGAWSDSSVKSSVDELAGEGSRWIAYELPNDGDDFAAFTPTLPRNGLYEVLVTWAIGANCFDAGYTVRHEDGETVSLVDQIPFDTAGYNSDRWVSLGRYRFREGANAAIGAVEVSKATVTGRPSATWNQRVYADGLKLVYCGSGAPFFGDGDNDGHVTLIDYAAFTGCLAGPNTPPPANCLDAFDADADGDVDLADFREFSSLILMPE